MERYSIKNYKDDRDCHTHKMMTKSMYILVGTNKKPFVHRDGHLMLFFKQREAVKYIMKHNGEEIWKVKKVKLDITTL